jgi:glycosyltransferase involved in cell wall biosynthesis
LSSVLHEPAPRTGARTRPRICFVGINNLPVLAREFGEQRVGGAELQQTLLAKALVRHGYEVSMVVADHGQADGASWDGIKTYKTYRHEEGLPVIRFVYPRWTRTWAAMRRADADIYYVSCAGMHVAEVVMFARAHRRKVVFRIASDSDCDPKTLLIRFWRDRKLYAYGLRRVDAVLAQTPVQQQAMMRNFARTSELARSLANPSASPADLPDRDISVLWVSNIQQLKRPELLLDLAQTVPHLKFHMVGGVFPGHEALYAEIRQRAESLPNVTFHGNVSYHGVSTFYARARVLVNTSDIEGFPNTYLQAWAHGTPVVAFHDPNGVIEREGLGVAAKDIANMSVAAQELCAEAQIWEATSNRCKAFMTREYDEDKTLVSYLRVIDGLAISRTTM